MKNWIFYAFLGVLESRAGVMLSLFGVLCFLAQGRRGASTSVQVAPSSAPRAPSDPQVAPQPHRGLGSCAGATPYQGFLGPGLVSAGVRDGPAKPKLHHNKIEDMKGKIRVYVRVRPMSGSEVDRGCEVAF